MFDKCKRCENCIYSENIKNTENIKCNYNTHTIIINKNGICDKYKLSVMKYINTFLKW